MELELRVASVHETTTQTVANVKGVDMRVSVPCVEVELSNGSDCGAKLTFSGADVAAALAHFKAGHTVKVTF